MWNDLLLAAPSVLAAIMSVPDFRQRHTRRFRSDQIRAAFIAGVFFALFAAVTVVLADSLLVKVSVGLSFAWFSVNWWVQARIAREAAASGGRQ